MAAIVKAVNQDTAAVFLTSPHNPTGTMITKAELDDFLDKIDPDVLVVLDEAYYEYIADDEKNNTLAYLNKFKNIILLRTFSKIYGLAGLRIGYGIADASLISSINKLSQPFNVNSIAQKAALVAIENQSYIKESMEKINAEKLKFYALFDKNNIRYIKSYANFILIEVKEHAESMVEDLLKNGFIVRLGDFLGVKGFIRVSISTPEINDAFLNLFLAFYSKYNI
jgi:histidinol-phosphate aminotransferase